MEYSPHGNVDVFGDTRICNDCGKTFDTNDTLPPNCDREEFKKKTPMLASLFRIIYWTCVIGTAIYVGVTL
jgi:reverse gyrase